MLCAIYNGGVIKIITNHFLYANDKELLPNSGAVAEKEIDSKFREDLEWIYSQLHDSDQQHFFDCLKYLVKHKRLELVPVRLSSNGMAHYKQGLFFDDFGNCLYIDGSCNFTGSGLLENGESFQIYRSWGSDFEKKIISPKEKDILDIIKRKSNKYLYLKKEQILDAVYSVGKDKSIEDLLVDERKILETEAYNSQLGFAIKRQREELEKVIENIKTTPKFPFDGFPYDYQKKAYEKWREASCMGIFEMATGTGKTITALNCLLNLYLESGVYQAIILIPGEILLGQWSREVKRFNFSNIILASSKNSNWRSRLTDLKTDLSFDRNRPFIVIATYQTFITDTFQKTSKKFPSTTLLIADEAHRIGAPQIRALLPDIEYSRRIGLSATPKRDFDEIGNNAIDSFFNSKSPYTFSLPMREAIEKGFLCKYEYTPHIVYLDEEEMSEYADISRKLTVLFHGDREDFNNNPVVKMLLMKRKRIIHKAKNKIVMFHNIVSRIAESGESLRYSFVYVPEGKDDSDEALVDVYANVINENYRSVKTAVYIGITENKGEIIRHFENGDIDMLFAMKCLDEGVDIPKTELAIFCSSTGTPRQFIQRRGRVLRTHPDKNLAKIHDMIVFPFNNSSEEISELEKTLIKSELIRVVHFASLALNYSAAMEVCDLVARNYGLDVYALEYDLDIYGNDDDITE